MNPTTEPASTPTSLAPCPDSPNCVSSQAASPDKRIAPFSSDRPGDEMMSLLRGILESMPGSKLVASTDTYLKAEFTTRWLRYVDDLELLLDRGEGVVHVRSASRVGTWDLGANRRRVETLRRRLASVQK